jgi:hypothetical protein
MRNNGWIQLHYERLNLETVMSFPTVRLLDVDSLVSGGTIQSVTKYCTKRIQFYQWVHRGLNGLRNPGSMLFYPWDRRHSHAWGF